MCNNVIGENEIKFVCVLQRECDHECYNSLRWRGVGHGKSHPSYQWTNAETRRESQFYKSYNEIPIKLIIFFNIYHSA